MVGAIVYVAIWPPRLREEGKAGNIGLQNIQEAVYSDREKGFYRCIKIQGHPQLNPTHRPAAVP